MSEPNKYKKRRGPQLSTRGHWKIFPNPPPPKDWDFPNILGK
jgi:hypothetical protein